MLLYSPVSVFCCLARRFLVLGTKYFSLCRELLNYLDKQDIKATFFVVGSRIIERPQVLIEEYMASHEISVHTWSHHASLVLVPVLLLADDTP